MCKEVEGVDAFCVIESQIRNLWFLIYDRLIYVFFVI